MGDSRTSGASLDATGLSLFDGGGDLGGRMRALDWSKTPLGPVSRWPQSLKTCVRIVLTSRQPMFVRWGEELINLHNDAYRSIVGGKHPGALGQPASVVWREIWDQVGPRAERAMRFSPPARRAWPADRGAGIRRPPGPARRAIGRS